MGAFERMKRVGSREGQRRASCGVPTSDEDDRTDPPRHDLHRPASSDFPTENMRDRAGGPASRVLQTAGTGRSNKVSTGLYAGPINLKSLRTGGSMACNSKCATSLRKINRRKHWATNMERRNLAYSWRGCKTNELSFLMGTAQETEGLKALH